MIGRERLLSIALVRRESLARCSCLAWNFFVKLVLIADDLGRTEGSVAVLAGLLYPFERQMRDMIPALIAELAAAGELQRYGVRGKSYLLILGWGDLVRVDRVRGQQHPAPPFDIPVPHVHDFGAVQLPLEFDAPTVAPVSNIAELRREKSL